MRFVCLSDTHLRHGRIAVPDGDVLLHAGDLTSMGAPEELAALDRWLAALPHRHKVVIAGNHDFGLEIPRERARELLPSVTYLQDEELCIDGLRIWGSPWQPRFFDWAFNLERGAELAAKWALIPAGIDVLLTHGPPLGVLDRTQRGEPVGCADLKAALERVRPRVHVFGHIHEASGVLEQRERLSVNASICDLSYRAVHPGRVFDLEAREGSA